jgi:hypothetical protein
MSNIEFVSGPPMTAEEMQLRIDRVYWTATRDACRQEVVRSALDMVETLAELAAPDGVIDAARASARLGTLMAGLAAFVAAEKVCEWQAGRCV